MDIIKFKKNQLASAITIASGTLLLAGCIDGDSSTTTNSSVTEYAARHEIVQQKTQSSDIFGVVQDTNGNPIAGATVSIGGIVTKTDSAGAYKLSSVPVTGLATTTSSNNGQTQIVTQIPE